MKKRILSMLITIVMAAVLLSTAALAETDTVGEGGHTHPICGATCSHNGEHAPVLWTAIGTVEELLAIDADSHYYLTADLTLEAPWTLSNNVALDLNGRTLTGRVRVGADISFTLTDCKGSGKLSGDIEVAENAAVLSCHASSPFYQYGGTIENTAENGNGIHGYDYYYYGGTVIAEYAVNDMYTIHLYQIPDIRGGKADFYAEEEYVPTFVIAAALELPAEAYTVDFKDRTGTFTFGWSTYMSGVDCTRFFTSVNAGTFVEKDTDGELQLTALAFTQQPTKDNDYTAAVNDPDPTWQWYELGTKVFTVDDSSDGEIGIQTLSGITYESEKGKVSEETGYLRFFYLAKDDIVTVTFDGEHSGTVSSTYINFGAKAGNTWTGTMAANGNVRIDFADFTGGETFTITVARIVPITELTGRTGASLLTRSENAAAIMDGKEYVCVANGVVESEPVEFVHVHGGWTFSYAPDGEGYGLITATCGNEGCPLNGGSGKATCHVIIDTDVEYKYSGYTCPVDVDAPTTESDWYNAGLACPAVESYSLTEGLEGSAAITVDGEEACTVPYTLQKGTLTAEDFTFSPDSVLIYNGHNKPASVTAKDPATVGTIHVKYCQNDSEVTETKNVGTYSVQIDVDESDYYEAKSDLTADDWEFTVEPKDINGADVMVAASKAYYTGNPVQPQVDISRDEQALILDQDFRIVSCENNIDIGENTASVTVQGIGNYTGTKTVTFSIAYATKDAAEVLEWLLADTGWFNVTYRPIFTPKDGYEVSIEPNGHYSTEIDMGTMSVSALYVRETATGNIYQVAISYQTDLFIPTIDGVSGNPTEWTKDDVTLTVNAADVGAAGLAEQAYSFDGGTTWQRDNTKTYTANTAEIIIKVRDVAGNITAFDALSITMIDKDEPSAGISVSGTAGENGWYTSDMTVTIREAEDTGSGLAAEPYSFDGGLTWQSDSTKTYTETTENVVVYIRDNVGNKTGPYVPNINIDKDRPTIDGVSGNPTEWTKDDVTLTVNAADVGAAGLAEQAYSFDNGQTWQRDNTKTYTANTEDIIIKVRDVAGNITTFDALSITMIDKTAPDRITVGADPHTTGDWYTAKPTIIVGAKEEESGLAAEPYSFDGGVTWCSSNSKEYDEGIHTLIVWVRDNVGNIAKCQPLTLKIDTTAPGDIAATAKVGEENYASGSDNRGDVVITLTGGEDASSGFDKFQYKIGEDSWQDIPGSTFTHAASTDEDGVTYKLRAVDKAGNASGEVEFTVKKSFPVRFNACGGTGEMADVYIYQNGSVTMPGGFTREGYTFSGWYTDADYSGTEYLEGSELRDITESSAGGFDLYAKWTVNEYKVTWINYGGDGWEKNFDYGVAITLPTIPDFAIMMHQLGYTQTGWLCSDNTVEVGDTMPAKDLTFTAQYTPNTYTVKFDANGGTGEMPDQSFTYDAAAQALTTNAFTRDDTNLWAGQRVRKRTVLTTLTSRVSAI